MHLWKEARRDKKKMIINTNKYIGDVPCWAEYMESYLKYAYTFPVQKENQQQE